MGRRHPEFVGPGERATRLPAEGALDRGARALLDGLLGRMTTDRLEVRDGGQVLRAGPGGELEAVVEIRDPAAYRAVALQGSSGLGLAYANGWWEADDLPTALRVMNRNLASLERVNVRVDRLTRPVLDPVRRLRRPDPRRDRADIHAHYDLGNEFFELFLDETMMYSCALFEHPGQSLADAQRAKLDRLCQLLRLGPDDHVLEIGTGWGGFAVHAAQRHGCRVTTTTISDEQYEYARKRVAEAGLADRVQVRNDDYRQLTGTYDKLVSIEMIEAVDWREYDAFFGACARLLRPDGLAVLQAIVIPDQDFARRKHRTDFIKRYIFPGGCLPSVAAILDACRRGTDFRLVGLDDIGAHYVPTLRAWRHRLLARQDELRALGHDERFERFWAFYLAYCEAGFLDRHISDVHLVLARPGWRPEVGASAEHI